MNLAAKGVKTLAERDHGKGHQRRQQNQRRGQYVHDLFHMMGDDILLEEKFDAVGDGLEDAARAYPVRTDPVLDERADAAFGQFHDHEDQKIYRDDQNDFGQNEKEVDRVDSKHAFTLVPGATRGRRV